MLIEEITMDDFASGLAKTRTVIIPFGSTEEHGPHLPLGTDTIHAYEVCKEASKQTPVFVAPPLFYGVCRSTRNHAGTVGIRPATLRTIIADLVSDLYRQGLRHFLVLSGHASSLHMSCLIEVGEEFLQSYPDIEVAVVSLLDLGRVPWREVLSTEDDSHAGEAETSVMLHLRPHLVGKARPREWPRFPEHLLVRDKLRYWPGGVWGDASQASKGKGRKLFELSVAALVRLIKDLNFDGKSL
ncbi:MAG: creatininase family protein [Deltaproteobacteria bacterium]|nr:creatininase family protein [Deltaproteobacteria bacterium]